MESKRLPDERIAARFHFCQRQSSVELRDPVLDREFHQAGEIADTKFEHHSAAIGIDRLGRQKQHRPGLGARFPFYDELQDLTLAAAQVKMLLHMVPVRC